ncbi:hypothetical protein AB0I61_17195 [Polymorphospora rubra]|uniref:hypothetical protein n=1 Tax=Polymorphospora rubra TaxID=338584 RepID=UPI0033F22262
MSRHNHLATTPITIRTHRCGALTATALTQGIHTRVDLTPLNPTGEAHALITGRQTYTLTRTGLVHRDIEHIAGGSLRGPVLADHVCGRPIPAAHRAVTAQPAPQPAVVGCPF